MALRIRKNGRILCAAMHPAREGDTYIGDGLHYEMSVINKVIGTEENEKHKIHGEWWWMGNIPEGVEIDKFYSKDKAGLAETNQELREECKRKNILIIKLFEDELKRNMRINMPGISPTDQEETWQRYKKLNNLN